MRTLAYITVSESACRAHDAYESCVVPVQAGSQLIAHFSKDLDLVALRKTVESLLLDASGTLASVKVARGCTVVYIAYAPFKGFDEAAVDQIIGKLHRMGATLTHLCGKEGRSGVLHLQSDGLPQVISCSATKYLKLIKAGALSACDRLDYLFTSGLPATADRKVLDYGRSNTFMALAVMAAAPQACWAGGFAR